MEDFNKLTEKMLIRMIGINYKMNEGIPLSNKDKEQFPIIIKCAKVFNKLNENLKLEKKKDKIEDYNNLYGIFEPSEQESNFEGFSDLSDENKDEIKNEPKTDPKIDDKITYETDLELIEICKTNKTKFDELTKQLSEKLNNVQDSFWTTIDCV